MTTSDLTRTQFPTEFWTIGVRNFKDSAAEMSLHGLFHDRAEAETVAREIESAYPDFISTRLVPIQFGTIEQVQQAQDLTNVAPATAETYASIRETVRQHAPGSYSNPTPESIAAEVASEAELREQMRTEAEADLGPLDGGPLDEERLRRAYLRNQGFVPEETGSADAAADEETDTIEGIATDSAYNDGFEGEQR